MLRLLAAQVAASASERALNESKIALEVEKNALKASLDKVVCKLDISQEVGGAHSPFPSSLPALLTATADQASPPSVLFHMRR